MENRKTALGLLNFSKSYLDAAKFLNANTENKTIRLAYRAPIDQLVGHGLEILLKSYLRNAGFSDSELQKLGHDLEVIFREFIILEQGFSISEQEEDHLKLLNTRHNKPYLNRYLETGYTELHKNSLIISLAERIDSYIRPKVEMAYKSKA
jgi:hypothetical protein